MQAAFPTNHVQTANPWAMTTRELLIREINRAPEDVLRRTLRYLQVELQQRRPAPRGQTPQTTGPYADYWNQFICAFAIAL